MPDYRIRVKIDSRDAERGGDRVEDALKGIERKSKATGLAIAGAMAAGAVAVGFLARSFISAASEAEQYQVRLQGLLGTVEEGNRLFDEMRQFAAAVPFEFREIMSSATTLAAVVKGGVDEVAAWMPLIGDLAAAFGLTIEETTGQMVRMLSAGAGAADMFRERGVLAMLGFQQGVNYSTEQTRKIMIDAWADVNSKFRGATDDLAGTWKGTLSQLSDAWFLFRTTVMEQGISEELTGIAKRLVELARDPSVQEFAVNMGEAFAYVIGKVGWFLEHWTDFKAAILAGLADAYGGVRDWARAVEGTWDHTRAVTLGFAASVLETLHGLTTDIGRIIGTMSRRFAAAMEPIARYGPAGIKEAAAAAVVALRTSSNALEQAQTQNSDRVQRYIADLKAASAAAAQASLAPDTPMLDRWIELLEDAAQAALQAGQGSAEAAAKAKTFQEMLDALRKAAEGAAGQGGSGGLKALKDRLGEVLDELERLNDIDLSILQAFEDLSGITSPRGVVGDIPQFEVPELDLPELGVTEAMLEELTEGYEAFVESERAAELNTLLSENFTRGIQGALSTGLSEFFKTGELEFEDFFQRVGDLAADILGEVLARKLTRVMEENMTGDGAGGLFGGTTGTLLAIGMTVGNIQAAEDPGYAAAGAAIGAGIGAALGAMASTGFGAGVGAQWGAVLGSWLGGMIKHGAPSFTGSLEATLGELDLKGQLSWAGGRMGQDIAEGARQILSMLGGELEALTGSVILEMRKGLAVTVNGIRTYFDENSIGEGIQFAIVEALKNADITGISSEARAALENTTARTMEALLSDLDFARWIEQLDLGDAAKKLDDFVDEFRIAWDRMVQLGIDGAAKLEQWAVRSLEGQRMAVLGLQESADVRIRREAEMFNAELLIIQAQQEARRAELLQEKAFLEGQVEIVRAHGELGQLRLDLDRNLLRGERNLLAGKLGMLEAVEQALAATDAILASLPDLISEGEIRDAIRRAGAGAGGPTEADRDSVRQQVERWGLRELESQLATTGDFVSTFAEQIKDMGFSSEEAAAMLARAAEEQQRLMHDLGEDAIAQLGTTSVGTIQRMAELGETLAFLRNNFTDLGITLPQLRRAVRELDAELTLSIASGLERYIDDADVRRQLQILEHELFINQKRIEIEAAKVMGLITEANYRMLLDLLELASEWEPPELDVPPDRHLRSSFNDARRDAERIAESFRDAKASVADFLNKMLVGEFGGVSPVGGVLEAQRQFDEVLRQARTGNIGAIGSFDEYASTLLRQAREAYGSAPEFQAIYDYVLASGRDLLELRQGREGNVVFDERFFDGQNQQINESRRMRELLGRIEQHLSRNRGPIAGAGVNR